MSTLITPNDGTLAAFTLGRDPDRGERVGLNLNNRQLVTAGGVLDVLVKGPASQSFPLGYRGLKRKEFRALDTYITQVLIGGVKTFRIQFGNHQNLLTRTINLGDDPPWQLSGASVDPIATYPASVLAPDYSKTALQVAYKDWDATGANQKITAFARLPEGNSVTAVNGDQVHIGCWMRTLDGVSLTDFHRLKIQTDSEDGFPFTCNLTDVWTWFTSSYLFGSGGGANLAFEVGSLATSGADYTVFYWQPQLVLNQAAGISSGSYQTVPETDFGHIDVKFGSPPISWKETVDDGFDVTLNLYKIGSG